ncbi:unnamed protein product [Durusdinium trenchii]|uniref:Amino acid transporter AVT1D (AtAvt1D) n=2 Tax=Durusdinium trenchii TaxID=1381693 RepID=A0ABP0NEX2_9DINO
MVKSLLELFVLVNSVAAEVTCAASPPATSASLVQTKRPVIKVHAIKEPERKASHQFTRYPHVANVQHPSGPEAITPASFRPDALLVFWPTLSLALTFCSALAILAMTVRDKAAIACQTQPGYQRSFEQRLGVWDASLAIFSGVMGVGVLSMPYAMSRAGFIAAPLILLVVLCSAYTAHLLVWALQAQPSLPLLAGNKGIAPDFFLERACEASRSKLYTWGSLVENAFGSRACIAANIFLSLETWGYLLSYIVGASMNISQLLGDEKSRNLAVLLSVAFAYMLATPRSRLNLVSNCAYLCCFVMLIVSGLLLPQPAPWSELKSFDSRGLFSVAGILVFSPAGHAFFPDIQRRMRQPELFPICLRRAYGAAAVLYLAVGLAGYLLFGSSLQPSAVQNVGWTRDFQPLPKMHWLAAASAVAMAIRLVVMQAFVLPTLTSSLQQLLGTSQTVQGSLLPCILAASGGVAAFFSAQVALLLNFLGGAICAHIAFTMPVLCYWKLSRQSRALSWSEQVGLTFLFLIGCGFSFLGLLSFAW